MNLSVANASLPERRYKYRFVHYALVVLLAYDIATRLPLLASIFTVLPIGGLIVVLIFGFLWPGGCLIFVLRGQKEGYLLTLCLGLYGGITAIDKLGGEDFFAAGFTVVYCHLIAVLAFIYHRKVFGPVFTFSKVQP